MMNKTQFKVPIYKATVTLFKDATLDGVCDWYGLEPQPGFDGGVFHIEEGGIIEYALVLEDNYTAGILAHECLHLTNHILRDCGVYPDFQNDEPQCYLHGWIVDQVTEFYEE